MKRARSLIRASINVVVLTCISFLLGNGATAQTVQNDTTDPIAVELYIWTDVLASCPNGTQTSMPCQVVAGNGGTWNYTLNAGEYLSGTKISCTLCTNTPVASTACPGSTSSFSCTGSWTVRQSGDDIYLY